MINGKIISINLTDKTFEIISPDKTVYERFLGGRGLAGWLLVEYLEKNPLIFCTGPLTATGYQTTARCAVMHINPATGGLFRSDFGGKFANALNKAGYDGLMISGHSETPVSIVIDDSISFSDIPEGYAVVTPGADRNIKYCKILSDGFHTTHRGGTGTLMHSMNLASIGIKPAEEPKTPVTSAYEDIERLINASPSLTGRLGIGRFGTAALYDLAHARDILPNVFFNRKRPAADSNANGFGAMQNVSCGSCPIACRKTKDGQRIPEYDEFAMLLSIGVPFNKILKTYDHCLKQGIDIITACHCIQQSGMDALQFLYDIPEKCYTGLNTLTVKGVELPAIAPNGALGVALGYATSTNGADWTTAMALTHEILRKPVPTDRHTAEGKAVINIAYENAKAAADSIPVCRYALFSVSLEEYAKALGTTAAKLAECGNEIYMNEIGIIRRLGFGIETDRLPENLLSTDQQAVFDIELKKYHRMRGLS
jgi:aldehyde:ferredoxin oxidoreductase